MSSLLALFWGMFNKENYAYWSSSKPLFLLPEKNHKTTEKHCPFYGQNVNNMSFDGMQVCNLVSSKYFGPTPNIHDLHASQGII